MTKTMTKTLTGIQATIFMDLLKEGKNKEAKEYCDWMIYLNNTLKRKYPQHERTPCNKK